MAGDDKLVRGPLPARAPARGQDAPFQNGSVTGCRMDLAWTAGGDVPTVLDIPAGIK
jgi:hypothetical protein